MRRITIHQPHYFPWVPYFQKIDACDLFIYLDSVQFQKNGLQNRNQIKTAAGAAWLTVPVQHKSGQKIVDTLIEQSSHWQTKHWRTICQSYSKAPFFKFLEPKLEKFFIQEWQTLSELNIALVERHLEWMDISVDTLRSSQLTSRGQGTELILNICKETGADIYVAGPGAKNYLDFESFERNGISIEIPRYNGGREYPQQYSKSGFISDLSALDLLLNCGSNWREYL